MKLRIRYQRNLAELTQKELADRLGISTSHMSGLENGHKGLSLKMLHRISKQLRCKISDLYEEEIQQKAA